MSDAVRRRLGTFLKQLAAGLILVGVAFFFSRAIRRNWAEIRAHDFQFDYPYVAFAFLTVVASGLLSTYAWQVTINSLSGRNEMTFGRSVATVNSTGLTKYVPGKFWSYALQMYWLSRSGYSKSLVLYVNLTNLLASLLTGVMLAVGFLVFTGRFPLLVTVGALSLLLALELICLRYYGAVFTLCSALVRRLLKRELGDFEMPMPLMLRVHGIQLLAQLISGVGGYILCFGIGYHLDSSTILLVMASLILSDAAGFVVFLVPGGLGVREATMYFLLGGAATGSLALVLPLVTRLLYMTADLLLGAIAFRLLKRSVQSATRS